MPHRDELPGELQTCPTLIAMMRRNASLYPEKTAFIGNEVRISHQELYQQSTALGGYLLEIGLDPGDRVGLLLEKSIEAIVSFLGVACAGGVVFPLDYFQTVAHLHYVVDLTQPFSIITQEKFRPLLTQMNLPFPPTRIISIDGPQTADATVSVWDRILAGGPFDSIGANLQADDVVYLNFTSGTTGMPKGAITTHANIYWNTRSAVEVLKLREDDIHICMFPVFLHPHELFARTLYLGGTSVLVDGISPKAIVKAINQHNVTCFMAIGSIYETLTRQYEISPFQLHSLRVPESGGMHLYSALINRFEEYFGIPIFPVWGSTETSGISLATSVEGHNRPGSMGKVCPYYEVKLIGKDGQELPPDRVGEMLVRGPAVCREYYNNPVETAKNMKDGWFYTGDLVRRDSDNHFYFADRKARMMKVAGMKVYPVEIEELLTAHPDIAEASVVKVRDRVHGELPKAFVVSRNGQELDKNLLRKYCEEKLSKYKVPRVFEFVHELPKSPGGKILWQKL